jgi:SAM-dependent methyltransferase
MTANSEIFSSSSKQWNTDRSGYIGGVFSAPNLSHGFHGLLRQWWDHYVDGDNKTVLLVCENVLVRKVFEERYPTWTFDIIDLYPDLQNGGTDIIVKDICKIGTIDASKYDLIINQANLEHCYDPFGAMMNVFQGLKPGGVAVTHTHTQTMPYHAHPVDCVRFMKDWWYIIAEKGHCIELCELFTEHVDVLSCYRKLTV